MCPPCRFPSPSAWADAIPADARQLASLLCSLSQCPSTECALRRSVIKRRVAGAGAAADTERDVEDSARVDDGPSALEVVDPATLGEYTSRFEGDAEDGEPSVLRLAEDPIMREMEAIEAEIAGLQEREGFHMTPEQEQARRYQAPLDFAAADRLSEEVDRDISWIKLELARLDAEVNTPTNRLGTDPDKTQDIARDQPVLEDTERHAQSAPVDEVDGKVAEEPVGGALARERHGSAKVPTAAEVRKASESVASTDTVPVVVVLYHLGFMSHVAGDIRLFISPYRPDGSLHNSTSKIALLSPLLTIALYVMCFLIRRRWRRRRMRRTLSRLRTLYQREQAMIRTAGEESRAERTARIQAARARVLRER